METFLRCVFALIFLCISAVMRLKLQIKEHIFSHRFEGMSILNESKNLLISKYLNYANFQQSYNTV